MLVARLASWAYRRFRPEDGWLALLLLLGLFLLFGATLRAAAWVPETDALLSLIAAGGGLTWLLARRLPSARRAWLWLTLYGLVLTVVALAEAPLPWQLLRGTAAGPLIRRDLLLFAVRWLSWLEAVVAGETSRETLPFATLLGLGIWFLTTGVVWSVVRRRQPLQALTALAFALTINSFLAGLSVWYVAGFLLMGMMLAALLNYANLVRHWEKKQVDYSDEIRNDLLTSASAIAVLLMTVAVFLPAVPVSDLTRRVLRSDTVQAAEAELARSLAGVRRPETGVDLTGGGSGVSGAILPRSFLIGDPPELADLEIFRGRVEGAPPAGWHWRGISIDAYGGSGWRLTDVDFLSLLPPAALTQTLQATAPVTATVRWTRETPSATRYHVGAPLRFSEAVTISVRDDSDLVRAAGTDTEYTVQGRVSIATAEALRAADPATTSAALLARYTALPEGIPRRVYDLAAEVAGDRATAYDQALALERFLHQYRYSLADAETPPAGADAVDFFLFESKIGYCDYYASAFVVMARSLGIPARYAVGYLAQTPDGNGEQVVVARDAHSWAEVYFPGYGWIEFEPTPPFAPRADAGSGANQPFDFPAGAGPADAVPPIPADPAPAAPLRLLSVGALVLLTVVCLAAVWWWLRRRSARPDDEESAAFGRVQRWGERLGRPPQPSETPGEYGAALLAVLARRVGAAPTPAWRQRLAQMAGDLQLIVERYARRQYGATPPPADRAVAAARRRLAQTMRRLRFRRPSS